MKKNKDKKEKAKEKEILNMWEQAGKPRGDDLEKRAKKISDKQVDEKFGMFFFCFRICVFIIIVIFIIRNTEGKTLYNLLSETWQYLFCILLMGLIYRLSSLIKQETKDKIGAALFIAFIVGIVIALCVRLFGAVGGGIAGVLAVLILLKVLKII